jgi:hypothetical protein
MALSTDESWAASWAAGFEASPAASILEPPVPPLPPFAVAPPKPDTPPDPVAPPESEEPPNPSGPKSCGPSGLAWGASATSDPLASNPEPPSALVWPAKPPVPPIVPPVPPVRVLLLEHAAKAIATTPRRRQDAYMTLNFDASQAQKGSVAGSKPREPRRTMPPPMPAPRSGNATSAPSQRPIRRASTVTSACAPSRCSRSTP